MGHFLHKNSKIYPAPILKFYLIHLKIRFVSFIQTHSDFCFLYKSNKCKPEQNLFKINQDNYQNIRL